MKTKKSKPIFILLLAATVLGGFLVSAPGALAGASGACTATVTNITSSAARLTWTTDGTSQSQSNVVVYSNSDYTGEVYTSGRVSNTNLYADIPNGTLNSGTTYYWKVELYATFGTGPEWSSFALSGDLADDAFTTAAAPNNPTSPTQKKNDDSTLTNGAWLNVASTSTAKLGASVTHPTNPSTLTLYFELLANAGTFTTATTIPASPCSSGTAYGSCASKIWSIASSSGNYTVTPYTGSVTIPSITDASAGYKWQVLACDGTLCSSAWTAFNVTTPNFKVDTTAPTITAGNISVAGASGTGGAFKSGDTVTATWNNSGAGDNNSDIASATADLSQFGGGSSVAMTDTTACGGTASNNIYEACYTIVAGAIDTTNRNATVSATDNAGNSAGPTSGTDNKTVDNIAPTISAAGTVTLSTDTNADGRASISDQVTYAGGTPGSADGDGWTVNLSAYGLSATATGAQTIIADNDDNVAFSATETVTDNAGNTATGSITTSGFTNIDNVVPVLSSVSPADSAQINSVTAARGGSDVSYTLSEAASEGTIVFTGTAGPDIGQTHTCTLTGNAFNSGAHANFDMSDTTHGCTVAQDLVNLSTYTMTLNAKDLAKNSATQVQRTGIYFDITAPVLSGVAPDTNNYFDNITDYSDVSFTTDKALASGTIVFTGTSGADNGGSHTCTLVGTALNTGAHSNIDMSDTTNVCSTGVTLVDATVYTMTITVTDTNGNETIATKTGLQYDFTGWVQTQWDGTPAGTAANHPGDQTGFTDYASKDSEISLTTGSDPYDNVTLNSTDGNLVQTSDDGNTDAPDAGGFAAGTAANTTVTGSGTPALVELTDDTLVQTLTQTDDTTTTAARGTQGGWQNRALTASGMSDVNRLGGGASDSVLLEGEVKQILTGASHTCAVKTDGTVWCWGSNANGGLGDNTTTASSVPIQVHGVGNSGYLTGVSQVAAGATHTCAVKTNGEVYCWGYNNRGQLGDNTTTKKNTPVQVHGVDDSGYLTDVAQISAGYSHTCAVKTDGTAYCWGSNDYGALGDNTATTRYTPVQVLGVGGSGNLADVAQISAGRGSTYLHTCAVKTDGTAYCWGSNYAGQLGINSSDSSNHPTPLQVLGVEGSGNLIGVRQISAGDLSTCAVKTNGEAYCWGANERGRLGDNTTTQRNTPVQVHGVGNSGYLTDVIQIAAPWDDWSYWHTCALKTDGTAYCWGSDSEEQVGNGPVDGTSYVPIQVAGVGNIGNLSGIVEIDIGSRYSCALKTDGTVYCWGNNSQGQLGDNTTSGKSSPVQVIQTASGTWSAGFMKDVSQTAVGSDYVCALKTDGTVWCWGRNTFGQLGYNTTTNRLTPVQVHGVNNSGYLTDVAQISAGKDSGNDHTCALKTDGTVYCWGNNGNGQLGDNTTTQRLTPVQVKDNPGTGWLTGVSQISAGSIHTCALKTDGTVYCWGNNGNGQLGDNTDTQRLTPVQVKDNPGTGWLTGVSQVAAGTNHTCAVKTNGEAWCWGDNNLGQMGDNTEDTDRWTPVQVLGVGGSGNLTGVSQVTAGGVYSCAVKTDGTAFCWGSNSYGQLGDNTTTQRNTPVQVLGVDGSGNLTDVSQVSAGYTHTCAVKTDGTAWCWGRNSQGPLGDNTQTERLTPVQVHGVGDSGKLTGIAQIEVSGWQGSLYGLTCAVKTNGEAWCWGYNGYGQLGDNTTTARYTPVQVLGTTVNYFSEAAEVSGRGYDFTCARKTDGTVWCWGHNDGGQLGINSSDNGAHAIPAQVKGVGGVGTLSGVSQLSSGQFHSCALKTDGTVWCWGLNISGRLGDNTTTQRNAPVQVHGVGDVGYLTDVSQISAGDGHTCAVKTDGTVWCWGSNSSGGLGDNTTTASYTPIQVHGVGDSGYLTGVSQVAAGASHTCAVKTDGTVFCWGYNSYGQLGDNTQTERDVPVQVLGAGGSGNLTGVSSLAASTGHTCAAKTNGEAYCWGINYYGQLGDNTTSQSLTPVQVHGVADSGYLSGIVQISLSNDTSSCAAKTDGTAYCWGQNNDGQLGDNTTTNRSVPVQVLGVGGTGTLTNVSQIMTGGTTLAGNYARSCAVKTDGSAYCWGNSSTWGSLGDNSTSTIKNAPIQVWAPDFNSTITEYFGGGYVSSGTYTSYLDAGAAPATYVWDNFAWDGQFWESWGTTAKIQFKIKGSNSSSSVPDFSSGACDTGDQTADGNTSASSINLGTCTDSSTSRYLWYEATFTATDDQEQTAYLDSVTATVAAGVFTSPAIDMGNQVAGWGNVSWTNSTGQTLEMRFRSDPDGDFSNASDWATCTTVANGAGVTTGGCVTNGHRYIQYRAELYTDTSGQSPSLENLTVAYTNYASVLSGSVVQTNDGTTSTGFNLTGNNQAQAVVVGTGDSASVKLESDNTGVGSGADGSVTISASKNLNSDTIASGRTCADGKAYSVTGLTASAATLSASPAADCLAQGDKVMLINLQGDGTDLTNVGNYETLTVSSVSGSTVNFINNKTKYYGDGASDDTNIGTATTNQRVILQRLPQYQDVTIASGGTLTADAWDGTKGGVLAFLATGTVDVQTGGTIDMSGKGYREVSTGGPLQGESYNKVGVDSASANLGGGGEYHAVICSEDNAGGGYGTAGQSGNGGTASGGGTYGSADLTKLFFGSSSGYNGSFTGTGGGAGGGITFIKGDTITVSSNIVNNGNDGEVFGGAGGAGGSTYFSGNTLTVGTAKVTAAGGVGHSDYDGFCAATFIGGNGGDGRIHLTSSSITGTTSPTADTSSMPTATYYSSGTFTSGAVDTGQNNTSGGTIAWSHSGGQTITMKIRSAETSDFSSATDWGVCGTVSSGGLLSSGSPNCVTSSHRYLQYQASLSTADSSATPSLDDVTINYSYKDTGALDDKVLISSPYNTNDPYAKINRIFWSNSGSGTAKFQVRTAATQAGLATADWCGPDNGAAGCSTSTYFTNANGFDNIDADQYDGAGDRWVQYKMFLATTAGSDAPVVGDVAIEYWFNDPPHLQFVNAQKQVGDSGVIDLNYKISSTAGEETSAYAVLFYQPSGVTLSGAIATSDGIGDITLNNPNSFSLPSSGSVLLDGELLSFSGRTGNTLTGITRAQDFSGGYGTTGDTHADTASVFIRATSFSDEGEITGLSATPAERSGTWTSGFSGAQFNNMKLRIAASDGAGGSQVGYSDRDLGVAGIIVRPNVNFGPLLKFFGL